jgi:hypothetical protein
MQVLVYLKFAVIKYFHIAKGNVCKDINTLPRIRLTDHNPPA